MDITTPGEPTLVWHEGDTKNPAKVKEKDRLRLIDIVDIRSGRVGPVLERSGNENDAGLYVSFSGDSRSLDMEFPTPEARDFVFKKFVDMFQAYATAQVEKLSGDATTMRVAAIVDGGAPSQPGSTAPPKPPPQQGPAGGRPGGPYGARPGMGPYMTPAPRAGMGSMGGMGMGVGAPGMGGGMPGGRLF
jgi:hypothetical protein